MRKPLQFVHGCVIENDHLNADEPWKVYDLTYLLHAEAEAGEWFSCKTEAEAKALAKAYRESQG